MFKHALVCASFIGAIIIRSVSAQDLPTVALSTAQVSQQKVQVPGTGYEFVLGSFEFSADRFASDLPIKGHVSEESLLTALVTWISGNSDIPADYHLPRIVPMSSRAMTDLVYQRLPTDLQQATSIDQMRKVISLYSAAAKTIYLQRDWTGRTPAELSMLVHEMVHHLQKLNQTTFACTAAEEKSPYEIQEKWLDMFGLSLSSEFGLDQTTVVLTTACME